MHQKVFSISGSNGCSLLIGDNSLMFSKVKHESYSDFNEAWKKKFAWFKRVEIKFDKIKAIIKEENDDDLVIKYKTFLGIPLDVAFSFEDKNDLEILSNYFITNRYYQKTIERLSPIRAIRDYLIGLFVVFIATYYCYSAAIDMKNGVYVKSHGSKARAFDFLVELIGDKGVIALGILFASYLIYNMLKRFKNPPNRTLLLPIYR